VSNLVLGKLLHDSGHSHADLPSIDASGSPVKAEGVSHGPMPCRLLPRPRAASCVAAHEPALVAAKRALSWQDAGTAMEAAMGTATAAAMGIATATAPAPGV
jgi:hypothetical protein